MHLRHLHRLVRAATIAAPLAALTACGDAAATFPPLPGSDGGGAPGLPPGSSSSPGADSGSPPGNDAEFPGLDGGAASDGSPVVDGPPVVDARPVVDAI